MFAKGSIRCFVILTRTLVDGMVQVSERDIGLSVLRLVEHEKLVQVSAWHTPPSACLVSLRCTL